MVKCVFLEVMRKDDVCWDLLVIVIVYWDRSFVSFILKFANEVNI